VERNPGVFLPDLAMSLNNLATLQSEAGHREEALGTAAEAASLYRELVERNRDTFLPNLAASLNTLAIRQSIAGHREAAQTTAEEAVGLRRELVVRNSDAFLPDLAMSLNNLANSQSESGQWEKALITAEEAYSLYRGLAGRNRDAFLEVLAKACWTLGGILTLLGRHAEAVQVFAEATRAVLPGVRRYPTAYLRLSMTLIHKYLSSTEAAKVDPDVALMQEVIDTLGPYLKKEEE
jgi:tetratricopeptide (TPR) repeat protein